jgi:preprotein translocase subunit SecE
MAEKEKKPKAIKKWWHETIGEMRKVSWPTPRDAIRLTRIVVMVMLGMSLVLGLLDFVFSKLVTLLFA